MRKRDVSEVHVKVLKKIFFIILILGSIFIILSQVVIIWQSFHFIQASDEINQNNPQHTVAPAGATRERESL
ncbi:MAG: hypothetical protein K8I00_02185 [Candidatus Omnitrophica bacterium]|nr:hypothetical protein [Candidatus Omnitrophota bacterium]